MADLRSDFKLGENVLKNTEESNFGLVELAENVIPGEALKVTGTNSEGAEIVSIITAVTDKIKYLVIESGLLGEMAKVLHKGRTKVTFGGTFIAGDKLEFTTASKVIVAGGTNPVKGSAVDGGALNDTGFIDFDGGVRT